MELEHEIQRKIILKLIHSPSLSFNELWNKEGESNLFAYHLNKLESLGLVEKNTGKNTGQNTGKRPRKDAENSTDKNNTNKCNDSNEGKYSLTSEGIKLSAFIEGDTGKKQSFQRLWL